IVIDEMAYVAMPEAAAELLFQIISGRAERAAAIVTTNLPFSEWTTMFPNARLCKAMLDRLTDKAHIIETGTESYRFRRTITKKKRGKGRDKGKCVQGGAKPGMLWIKRAGDRRTWGILARHFSVENESAARRKKKVAKKKEKRACGN